MTIKDINIYIEKFKFNKISSEKRPVFIVGAPRSGTTLIYQSLISSFDVEYPTNFIAKFWGNPVFGYTLQQELYKSTREDFISAFNSYHGYSENSILEPHEFGYFWSRWFNDSTSHYTDVDTEVSEELINIIHNLLDISKKDWLFKNLTLGLKIPLIKKLFPNALFIYVKRDCKFIAQSLYKGRIDRFGNDTTWWSLEPKEINDIKKLQPKEQVVAQIHYITKQIEDDLEKLSDKNYIVIEYNDFLNNSEKELNNIGNFLNLESNKIIINTIKPKNECIRNSDFDKYIKKYKG